MAAQPQPVPNSSPQQRDEDTSRATTHEDDRVFAAHRGGKMAIASTVPLQDREDLSIAYTPGVAEVCRAIAEDPVLVSD